jgi:hypothetical protein
MCALEEMGGQRIMEQVARWLSWGVGLVLAGVVLGLVVAGVVVSVRSQRAVRAAGARADEVNQLIRALRTGTRAQRQTAAVALGEIGPGAARAVPWLYRALEGESLVLGGPQDPYVEAATSAIAAIAREDAVAQAYQLFKAEEGQQISLLVLLKVGEAAVPPLCEYVGKDRDAKTCVWAIGWLRVLRDRLGEKRELAVATLRKAGAHPDAEVRGLAKELLGRIGEQK